MVFGQATERVAIRVTYQRTDRSRISDCPTARKREREREQKSNRATTKEPANEQQQATDFDKSIVQLESAAFIKKNTIRTHSDIQSSKNE